MNPSFNPPPVALSPEALIDVYLDIRPKLERVIARRVGSKTLAADLAQEMFFRIGSVKAVLSTRRDAEHYFLRAALNASLDHLKVEGRRRELLHDSEPLFHDATPSPEAVAMARDDVRVVEQALSELPAKYRDILLLSRVDGFSHAEIAAQLGVSRSLIAKSLTRALVHCRRRLTTPPARKA